jgi:hypothetical protein
MLQRSQPPQMPAGYVRDGFPQQRGWSDRTLEIESALGAESISTRSLSLSR